MGALEDLGAQEEASVTAGDFESVARLQVRVAPLVAYLGTHGPAVADVELRRRLSFWLERRGRTLERMGEQIAATRARLDQLGANRGRLTRVLPAYQLRRETSRRLRVAV